MQVAVLRQLTPVPQSNYHSVPQAAQHAFDLYQRLNKELNALSVVNSCSPETQKQLAVVIQQIVYSALLPNYRCAKHDCAHDELPIIF